MSPLSPECTLIWLVESVSNHYSSGILRMPREGHFPLVVEHPQVVTNQFNIDEVINVQHVLSTSVTRTWL